MMKYRILLIAFIPAMLHTACRILPSKKIGPIAFEQSCAKAMVYPFRFDDTTGNLYLRQLREGYGLDTLVRHAQSDQERALLILDWAHRQWDHNGSNQPTASDPLSILTEARQGKQFRCVEYGIISASGMQSVGMKARQLGLKTRDVETTRIGAGHVLAEVWLQDQHKWALVDGQFNTMPVLEGVPLNALEFQEAIVQKKPFKLINLHGDVSPDEYKKYMRFIPHYLYYFDTRLDSRIVIPPGEQLKIEGKTSLMLVPVGADRPTVFQRKSKMQYLLYTHCREQFYAAPYRLK